MSEDIVNKLKNMAEAPEELLELILQEQEKEDLEKAYFVFVGVDKLIEIVAEQPEDKIFLLQLMIDKYNTDIAKDA